MLGDAHPHHEGSWWEGSSVAATMPNSTETGQAARGQPHPFMDIILVKWFTELMLLSGINAKNVTLENKKKNLIPLIWQNEKLH